MYEEDVIKNAVIQYANLFLFEFDDEQQEVERGQTTGRWVRIFVDVEAFRRLPDNTFLKHFRMPKAVFEDLVLAVGNHLVQMGRMRRWRTPLDVILLRVLWVMATPDTFRSDALQFNTSPGVLHFHYLLIIKALTEMAPSYITWPSEFERDAIKTRIEEKSGFPGVIGCIDSTHLYFTAPYEEPIAYINRHHSHSILAQAVSDDKLLVRDLYVGEPGSLPDSRVFRRSPLCETLLTNANMIKEDEHLLGDGGYILTDKLLVPYRNNGHLTPEQLHFNFMLASDRTPVEQLFGLAKGKWRRMRQFESHSVEYAVQHFVASFVLHNFILLKGDDAEIYDHEQNINGGNDVDNWILDDEVDPEGDYPNVAAEPDHPLLAEARAAGVVKRRRLTQYFQTGVLPGQNNRIEVEE